MATIGIYCITNLVNGKKYIGQSWNIQSRWYQYRTRNGNVSNCHFLNSLDKYGREKFKYEVLKELHSNSLTQVMLDCYEDFYIKKYDTMNPEKGYNKKSGGGNGKHSVESRLKMSESRKGKQLSEKARENISKANKGRRHTPEAIEHMRQAQKGRIKTAEHRQKISNTLKGHKNNVGQLVSEETRKKISQTLTGRKASEETKQKLREICRIRKEDPNYCCKIVSEETKQKMRDAWVRRKRLYSITDDYRKNNE